MPLQSFTCCSAAAFRSPDQPAVHEVQRHRQQQVGCIQIGINVQTREMKPGPRIYASKGAEQQFRGLRECASPPDGVVRLVWRKWKNWPVLLQAPALLKCPREREPNRALATDLDVATVPSVIASTGLPVERRSAAGEAREGASAAEPNGDLCSKVCCRTWRHAIAGAAQRNDNALNSRVAFASLSLCIFACSLQMDFRSSPFVCFFAVALCISYALTPLQAAAGASTLCCALSHQSHAAAATTAAAAFEHQQ